MIQVMHVSKRYEGERKNTLSDVDFSLPSTGLYFLMGESGSGKTTLASIIGGMDDAFDGDVLFEGRSLKEMSKKEKSDFRLENIGFSFQGGFLDGKSSVHDEVMKALLGKTWAKEEKERKIKEILEWLDLSGFEKRKIGELSGGEKKRVSLARAMVKEPRLLILDEPTAGLNPKLREKVMAKIRLIGEGHLVILITHDKVETKGAGLIRVKDRKATLIQEPRDKKLSKKGDEENKKISFLSVLIQSLKTFFRHFSSSGPSILAITISLTAFGIALFLISGVREGFLNMGTSAFDETTMVVEPKNNKNISGREILKDPLFLSGVQKESPTLVSGIGVEYMENLNQKVTSDSFLNLFPSPEYRYPQNFGIDILAHPLWKDAYPDVSILGVNHPKLLDDEVFLGIPTSAREYLMTAFPKLLEYFRNSQVFLKGEIGVEGVQGKKAFSLKVRGIYDSSRPSLMHTSLEFNSTFLEKTIGFDTSYNLASLDIKPHTLKKGGIVYVPKDKVSKFYRKFSLSKSFEPYCLEKFPENLEPKTGLDSADVKILVKDKKAAEVLPQDLLEIVERKEEFPLRECSFSSSVYTYIQGGMYAGFSLPVYMSKDRASLIELSDRNQTTEKNLGMFQIAGEEIPKGVVAADLSSSLSGNGVTFISPVNKKVDQGLFPSSDEEIALSSSLAREIYGTEEDLVGKRLCLLLLGDIKQNGASFSNIFYDADLTVSGIIENESLALYHDSFFPTALAFTKTQRSGVLLGIDSAIMKFESVESMERSLTTLRKEFPAYDFSCPFKELSKEIEKILNKISLALCIFAFVSLILSVFLLILTTGLAIKDDERGIGDYLALGFSPFKVRLIYVFYVLQIGIASFLQACLGLMLANNIMKEELTKVFGAELSFSGLSSYLIVFAICFGTSFVVSLLSTERIRKISPVQGFRL